MGRNQIRSGVSHMLIQPIYRLLGWKAVGRLAIFRHMDAYSREHAGDTARLMALVERETGYRVTVGTVETDSADAEMISAAPTHPAHMIKVSTRCLPVADYIIASQCVMILTLWSHPQGVPVFRMVPEKVDYAVRKAASHRGLEKQPAGMAEQVASSLVAGRLHQLRSTPSEITAVDYCHRECPGLRDLQIDAMTQNLRRNTGSLMPAIREMAPPDIWTHSQIMCAALAKAWCGLSGSDAAMLPYKAIGVETKAQKFLDLWRDSRGTLGERYVQTVDDWAVELGLKSLYAWEFRAKQ